jgi:hypothetical protein
MLLHKAALAAIAGVAGYAAWGGWAVISVANPPEFLEAGTAYRLEYTVRQHGVTLLGGLTGTVLARPEGGKDADPFAASSQAGSTTGRYGATITVPDADRVTLTIKSGFGAGGWGDLTLLSIPVVRGGQPRPSVTPVERGRQLFVAKGCGTCHVNGDVPEFAGMNRVMGIAPELTGRRLEAAYVRQRLTNPASLPAIGNATVRMPDLGLSPAEVGALVALVSGPEDQAMR